MCIRDSPCPFDRQKTRRPPWCIKVEICDTKYHGYPSDSFSARNRIRSSDIQMCIRDSPYIEQSYNIIRCYRCQTEILTFIRKSQPAASSERDLSLSKSARSISPPADNFHRFFEKVPCALPNRPVSSYTSVFYSYASRENRLFCRSGIPSFPAEDADR